MALAVLISLCVYVLWGFSDLETLIGENFSSSALAAFGVCAVLLEAVSPRLKGWGYQSCTIGLCAVMSTFPGIGPAISLVVVLNAILLRAAFRGKSHRSGAHLDILGDALPLVLFLASLKLLFELKAAWFVVALLYSACTIFLSGFLSPKAPSHVLASRRAMGPFLAGMALLGLYWTVEPSTMIAGALLYGMMIYGTWELSRTRAVSREELAETHLGMVRTHQEELYRELEEKSEFARYQERNRRLLETIQRNFAGARGFKQPLNSILKLLEGLFRSRSAVFFLCTDGMPKPYLFRSPDDSVLERAELTTLTEPLVVSCWRENRPFSRRRRSWPDKLLPEERSVAVAPVPGYGVLYLGHTETLFDAATLETLSLVGRQVSYLMQGLTQKVAQQQQLDFVSDEKRRLSLWLDRLEQLLEVSQKLGECASPQEAYTTLEGCLSQAVPHQFLAIIDGSAQPLLYSNSAPWNLEGVAYLVQQVAKSGKALLLNRIPSAKFLPLEEATSLMVVPLNRLRRALLLVECQTTNAFTQEHLDLCRMMAQLAETALLRLRLQEEYISASKDAAIGQMAAGLSHELNTPMGVISLELERAQMAIGKSQEKTERHLDRAEAALDTSQKILSALLYYTTSYAVNHDQMDLKEVVEELLDHLESDFVQLKVVGDSFVLKAYRLDLEQLLKQLLFNAVEAVSDNPKPLVEVQIRDLGPQISVEVCDNGEGVPDELRERIFEPFFTTKPVGKGLGLGLAVASQIARLHGGALSLDSKPEGGATFRLLLPREPVSLNSK